MKEINAFYNVERAELPVGSMYGSDIENLNSLQAGAGTKVMRADDSGLWLGAAEFVDAPFSVDMEGNVIMASATITGFLQDGEAAADVNANATTIDGGKITALSITASQIAASTITGGKIAAQTITSGLLATSNLITLTAQISDGIITNAKINDLNAGKINAGTISADRIGAGSITASKLSVSTLSAISANLGTITAGSINAATATITNLNASNITSGAYGVGGASQPSYLEIQRDNTSGGNAYLRWVGGSKMWSDTNNDIGINAIGGEIYFYCNSAQILYLDDNAQAVLGQDNGTYDVGLFVWGNFNTGRGDARIRDGKLRVDTTSSPSESLWVGGSAGIEGNLKSNHHDPRSSNSYNLGGSSIYWAFLDVGGITEHSLGFYDEGVTVEKDGKLVKVSDVEAIKMMRPHPTLKAKSGAPLLDKFSLPKEMFVPAKRRDGTEYDRDPETGYPIVDDPERYFDKNGNEKFREKREIRPDADGENLGELVALSLGAIRELDSKIEALQDELASVRSSAPNRPVN